MRIVWAILGLAFVMLGLFIGWVSALVLIGQGQIVASVGLLLGVGSAIVGAAVLTLFAYDVAWDKRTIRLERVFRRELLSWEDVEHFRKLFAGWTLAVREQHIEGAVLILLTYRRSFGDGAPRKRVVFFARARTPAFSLSTHEYRTFLDDLVPTKAVPRASQARTDTDTGPGTCATSRGH